MQYSSSTAVLHALIADFAPENFTLTNFLCLNVDAAEGIPSADRPQRRQLELVATKARLGQAVLTQLQRRAVEQIAPTPAACKEGHVLQFFPLMTSHIRQNTFQISLIQTANAPCCTIKHFTNRQYLWSN